MAQSLDLYDKRILAELDLNARISASKIAKKIQLPKESVNYRIKRLIKNKIVVCFYTMINASLLGYNYFSVSIKLRQESPTEEERIVEILLKTPPCTNIRVTQGPYNIVFMTAHKSVRDLKVFMSELGKTLGGNIIGRNISLITRTQKFNQRIFLPGESIRKRLDHDVIDNLILDSKDIDILKFFSMNGRALLTEASAKLKLDPKTIRYRIKRLEKINVISGYGTLVNYETLGFNIVQLDFTFRDPLTGVYVLEFFDSWNCLTRSYELLGKYDLSFEIHVETDEKLRAIISKFKEKFDNDYISFDVSYIFKNFATSWFPFNGKKNTLKTFMDNQQE